METVVTCGLGLKLRSAHLKLCNNFWISSQLTNWSPIPAFHMSETTASRFNHSSNSPPPSSHHDFVLQSLLLQTVGHNSGQGCVQAFITICFQTQHITTRTPQSVTMKPHPGFLQRTVMAETCVCTAGTHTQTQGLLTPFHVYLFIYLFILMRAQLPCANALVRIHDVGQPVID